MRGGGAGWGGVGWGGTGWGGAGGVGQVGCECRVTVLCAGRMWCLP